MSKKYLPASTFYHKNGNISSMFYYLDEILHRTDGPAIFFVSKTGKIYNKSYYINGERFKSFKHMKKYLKTLSIN